MNIGSQNLWKPALVGVILSLSLFIGAFGLYAAFPSKSGKSPDAAPMNAWEEQGSRVEIQFAIVDWTTDDIPYWWLRDRQPPVWETQVTFLLDHLQVRWVRWDFTFYAADRGGFVWGPATDRLLPTPPDWDKVLPNDTWEVSIGDSDQLIVYTTHGSGHGDAFLIQPETGTIGTMYVSFILPDSRLIELSLPVTNGTFPVNLSSYPEPIDNGP